MENNGYIKIYRTLTQWRWYKDANTFRLFLHLLMTANYKDMDFENTTIPRGSKVTSTTALADELSLSPQMVRTSIAKLISTGEITKRSTTKYTVLSVVNYEKYQPKTSRATNNQQTNNKPITNEQQQEKEYKEGNKERSIKGREYNPPIIPPQIAEAFSAFREMRTKIKKPLTDYAATRILSKLEKLAGEDYEKQKEILDQSTVHSWQGVYALMEDEGGAKHGQTVRVDEDDTLSAMVL